ncbi:hypothetical protein [Solibacillus sp. FSL K6-1554]|uniref:hypothetical protein n=1 Tax=Solibacillus sp. FSL K6-1554 TaxID=2921472 RepID=UPI0030FC8599
MIIPEITLKNAAYVVPQEEGERKQMTEQEFLTIQQWLQKNGNILTLCMDDSGVLSGQVTYYVVIRENLYVEANDHPIRTTDAFENLIHAVLNDYEVSFNITRSMFWLKNK